LVQTMPGAHWVSQEPQCCGLLVVFTHCSAQYENPLAHLHEPSMQDALEWQTSPQTPQSVLLVCVSTQTCSHRVRPAAQVQRPPTHTSPPAHRFLQVPQSVLLVWVSTQVAPQSVSAPQVHTLPSHDRFPRHVTPHAPQLRLSLEGETHPPAQTIWSCGQPAMHFPSAQTWCSPHDFPHAPQLVALDASSTQKPEHVVDPAGQVQEPPAQNAPPVHALPQAPQLAELVARLTQDPAHAVSSGAQLAWQTPALHTFPLAQTAAHAPQC